MTALFVSYLYRVEGGISCGYAIIENCGAPHDRQTVEALIKHIQNHRKYTEKVIPLNWIALGDGGRREAAE